MYSLLPAFSLAWLKSTMVDEKVPDTQKVGLNILISTKVPKHAKLAC